MCKTCEQYQWAQLLPSVGSCCHAVSDSSCGVVWPRFDCMRGHTVPLPAAVVRHASLWCGLFKFEGCWRNACHCAGMVCLQQLSTACSGRGDSMLHCVQRLQATGSLGQWLVLLSSRRLQ